MRKLTREAGMFLTKSVLGGVVALLAVGGLGGATAWGESITLAHGGRAAATIVIAADASQMAQKGAAELQEDVRKICGVELPIHRDGRAVAGTGLYIGRCQPTQETDFPDQKLNPEAYAITVRGGSVYFNGRYPTPTFFAVASFIEDDLGVKWFAPGELWTYIPQGTAGELAVEVNSRVSVPDVSPRIWSGNGWFEDWKNWNLRNKAVQSEVVQRRNFQNNMYRIFPPSQYARTHPEYYPLIDGKRWIPASDAAAHWWPCISNPEVVRLTVAYANHYFDTHPDQDSFSLGMDDIDQMCGCDKCRAMDGQASDYAHRHFSDRYYKFINEVAREVHKTHPDRYIGTLIYSIARPLPKTVDKLEPNVFGFMTEECFEWWQPGKKAADEELSRQWAKRCRHLSRYDYYGMGTITPRFAPHTMAEQIKFDGSLGFEGMYVEVYTFPPDTAPMIWALAKMQWDRSLNVDTLLNTFYADMYGSAAPTMHEYFDLLEKSWNTPRPGRSKGWVHRNIVAQAQAMSVEELDQGMALLDKAMGQSDDAKVRQRIEINKAGLRYGGYLIRTYALAERIAGIEVADQASADQVLKLAGELSELGKQRTAFWKEAQERQDMLGETLRGLGDFGYLEIGNVGELERPAALRIAQAKLWQSMHKTAGKQPSN